jgi:phospholipase C
MRERYVALNASPQRWAKTVMIVTYDEHGGFYDHVFPINVTADKPAGAKWSAGSFATTGVRVPAVIASPLVKGGSTYDQPLDHTSILQFIAARFGDGAPYSAEVAARAQQGIGSVADALNRDEPRSVIAKPPEKAPPAKTVGTLEAMAGDIKAGVVPKKGANAKAFEDAADQLLKQRPAEVKAKYPELLHWDKT